MQTHYNIRHYYLKHWQETLLTDPWGHDMGCLYICHTNPTMHLYTVRETNACPLAKTNEFWAGQIETWPGWVEFCIEHIRDTCYRAHFCYRIMHCGIWDWCIEGFFYTGLLWIPSPVNVLFVSLHCCHYNDVIMSTMASQITSLTIVYSTIYSGTNQRKHQSSTSLAFVRGIHRSPVNSPHKGLVTRKMFSFDDAIMIRCGLILYPSLWYLPAFHNILWMKHIWISTASIQNEIPCI